jgi:hypothetical protein
VRCIELATASSAVTWRSSPYPANSPPTQETPAAEAVDTVVFITNFFDELRRLTEAEGR